MKTKKGLVHIKVSMNKLWERITNDNKGEFMANKLELTEEISNQASVIELKEVESSQIAGIGYNPEASLLLIEFKNKNQNTQYVYPNVTQEQFDEFESADSVGRHFGQNLKTLDFCKLEG